MTVMYLLILIGFHTSERPFARRNLFRDTFVPAGFCGSFYVRKLFIQFFHEYLQEGEIFNS